jgi:hypothetical protein
MRAWIRSLLKVRDTPEALARGLAVGFFFGVSFLWGLQIVRELEKQRAVAESKMNSYLKELGYDA